MMQIERVREQLATVDAVQMRVHRAECELQRREI